MKLRAARRVLLARCANNQSGHKLPTIMRALDRVVLSACRRIWSGNLSLHPSDRRFIDWVRAAGEP